MYNLKDYLLSVIHIEVYTLCYFIFVTAVNDLTLDKTIFLNLLLYPQMDRIEIVQIEATYLNRSKYNQLLNDVFLACQQQRKI